MGNGKKGGCCHTGFIAMLLLAIGGINWGLVAAIDFNLVDSIFGAGSLVAKVIYILVGLSGLWGLSMLSGKGCCGGKCSLGKG